MWFQFCDADAVAAPGATLLAALDYPEDRYDAALFMELYSASADAD